MIIAERSAHTSDDVFDVARTIARPMMKAVLKASSTLSENFETHDNPAGVDLADRLRGARTARRLILLALVEQIESALDNGVLGRVEIVVIENTG